MKPLGLLLLLAAGTAAAGEEGAACAALRQRSQDQLAFEEATDCFAECRSDFQSWKLWKKAVLAGGVGFFALLPPLTNLVQCKFECRSAFIVAFLMPACYLLLFAFAADLTGFAFQGNGTICLKAATSFVFGRFPAWVGLAIGCTLVAFSTWEACRIPLDELSLRRFCARLPSDDTEDPDTKMLGITVSKATLERMKIRAKATVALGDVILDSGSLASFLHQGQPVYALFTFFCILMGELFARRQASQEDYTPHYHQTGWLKGWQADFIFFWRESILLGMSSPAFLVRMVLEFQNETIWSSYVIISALFSSTYTEWYPLAQLCVSLGSACVTTVSWGTMNEVSWSEDDLPHGIVDESTGVFEVLLYNARMIPRADFFARKSIQRLRSMHLAALYRLCEFISKGVVITALIHLLAPLRTYLFGLVLAALLWPVRLRTGHSKSLNHFFIWTNPYMKPGNYALTIPTCQAWQEPDSSSPALTAAFLSVCWLSLIALSVYWGWLQEIFAGIQELSPSSAHQAVKLALGAAGLLAHFGLIAAGVMLERRRKGWYEEDAAKLRELTETRRYGIDGPVIHAELLEQGPRRRASRKDSGKKGLDGLLFMDAMSSRDGLLRESSGAD